MSWLVISIFAYFFSASATILDKFLLSSKKVSHPATYTFYVGLLSAVAFLFIPFGFHFISVPLIIIALIGGLTFNYGLLFLFFAIQKDEASRVMPVVGAIIPVITYLFSVVLLRETLSYNQLIGILFLIIGGIIISLDFSSRRFYKLFSNFHLCLLAGTLLALAYTLFKKLYSEDSFLNIFIWTRLGAVLGAVSLLINFQWRSVILKSLTRFKKPKTKDYHHSFVFILAKSTAGLSSFMLNLAISLGSVTIVNALASIQYVFIFIMEKILVEHYPKVFKIKKNYSALQKAGGVVLITIGLILASVGGGSF